MLVMIYHKTILVIEDDPHERFFMERAFRHNGVRDPIHFVNSGEEAMDYLSGLGRYADRALFAYPTFIISDLNMPGADGFAMLQKIKSNPHWATIPVVIFTSSEEPADIQRAYLLGASFYHAKPDRHEELQSVLKILHDFWMTCKVPDVALPTQPVRPSL